MFVKRWADRSHVNYKWWLDAKPSPWQIQCKTSAPNSKCLTETVNWLLVLYMQGLQQCFTLSNNLLSLCYMSFLLLPRAFQRNLQPFFNKHPSVAFPCFTPPAYVVLAKESLAKCPIVKDHFWEAAGELHLRACPPFGSSDGEHNYQYLTGRPGGGVF